MWSVIRTETAEFEQRKDGRKIIMTFSMKWALAIFQKDYKDLSRNLFVSSTLIMPLFFAVFYSQLGGGGIDVTYFVINITFSLVATFVQCALIAEEKEKNMLRVDVVAGEHARHLAREEYTHVRNDTRFDCSVRLHHGIQSCEPTRHLTRIDRLDVLLYRDWDNSRIDDKDGHGSLAHRHAGIFLLLVLTDVVGVRGSFLYHRFARVLT